MKKPNLFFDFDGMKYDSLPSQLKYMNERYGLAVTLDEFLTTRLDKLVHKYRPDLAHIPSHDIYREFAKNYIAVLERHDDVLPMEGMQDVVRRLAEHYTLWTVTARLSVGQHVVAQMNEKHIPGLITGIHCVYEDPGSGLFNERPKRAFIETVPGEKAGFIDDSPSEIREVKHLVPSYLFDPHGRHDALTDIPHRVRSWEEIGKVFL